jgi:hypothetical protein
VNDNDQKLPIQQKEERKLFIPLFRPNVTPETPLRSGFFI